MKVLVIGGGIVGATSALHLTEAGHRVTLVDDATPGARTSDGSLAWLNVCSTGNLAYARLRKAALDLWRARKSKAPDMPAAFPGTLIWSETPGVAATHQGFLAEIGVQAQVLSAAEMSERVPRLTRPPNETLWVPDEGRSDPVQVTDWTRAAAAQAGAQLRPGRVTGLAIQGARVTGAILADGDTLTADATVLCAGNGSAPLLTSCEITLPVRRRPGLLVRTDPHFAVGAPVFGSPVMDFWQAEDGCLFLASSLAKTGQDAIDLGANQALATFCEMFHGAAPTIASVVQRDRPIPLDGFPLIGAQPGLDGLFVAVTHSGMTLAPVLAQSLTDLLSGAPTWDGVAPFTPGRAVSSRQESSPW